MVTRTNSAWVLNKDEVADCAANVTMDEIDAWKLFTRTVAKGLVEPRIVIAGDRDLGSKVLDTVSIIA